MKSNGSLPIGVFDSGIGGITVLKSLAEHFPQESFLYLGDTARLPYGSKSRDTIYKYSSQNIDYLIGLGVKAIVIACNSASSHYHHNNINGNPIYNVIEPGARSAISVSENKKIGVLGTRATIQSHAYATHLRALDQDVSVESVACPLFVPLAEEGLDNDPITNLIAYRYLQPLLKAQVDTVILGCTHYPILKSSIQRVLGNSINLVDSGAALCTDLERDFRAEKIERSHSPQKISIMTTDSNEHFQMIASQILFPIKAHSYSVVSL